MNRTILHLDADAFFASVEQATDTRLRGKPVAVGGEKRGIIASASYEARRFGVYTPMPTTIARRLCPKLVILPGDFDKYEFFSRMMFSYAYDFTPDIEIGSIDEGYFDLTSARKSALNIAQIIRTAIRQSLKLSVSEGVGSNKLISQIASKLEKPAAFQIVPHGTETQFLWPLANKWLPGIGPKTSNQLNAAGLARIGQIARTPVDLLNLLVGSQAQQLRSFALGVDDRPVIPVRAPAKSYSEQETFASDTTDEPFLEATLRRMADRLMAKVREDGKSIRTLTVKVRYNEMDEDQASESLEEPTDLERELYSNTSRLLHKAWTRRVSLRLVSLKFSNVYHGPWRGSLALDLSSRHREAQERLAVVVDDLRHRFGGGVLLRGHDFILRIKHGRGEEPASKECKSGGRDQKIEPKGPPRTQDFSFPRPSLHGQEGEKNLLANKPRQPPGRTPPTATSELREAPTPYRLAVVERQRLGHYAAQQSPDSKARRISTSPGPELQFRNTTVSRPILPIRSRTAPSFIPLNVHSYYSFLDSTLSIKAIIELARRHELPAVALTDKNNLHGAVEFAQAAAAAGIKPIIGAEVDWNGQRLRLYVQNQQGYANLCRILSEERNPEARVGRDTRSGDKSRSLDIQDQKSGDAVRTQTTVSLTDKKAPLRWRNTEGLLAVSASAESAHFFPDRFYLEIRNLESSATASPALPGVAVLPIHYESPSDRWKYDIVQSIRTLTLLRQPHPEKRLKGNYHFRTVPEMRTLFGSHSELLNRSLEIADRCSFEFALGKPQFPGFSPPDGYIPATFLHRLVMDGLRRRYPEKHALLKPQLEEELAIITQVGYEEYFLIIWDILQECRRRGIEWITRGSAADSLACYCLEISGVCPIRFDLYFRRFLNKERMALNKLPDIDVDFPHDRKDDVINLLFEKYGAEHTAVVGGFSTFQSRSAFAEVAKVLGVSEFQVRRLTERLPHFSRVSELTQAVAESQECRDLPFEDEPYHTALQMAHFLDGFPRYPKMHPCGLVLSRQPMNEIVPCFTSAKGYPTTHFDMDSVEAVGLIKMDILAQGGLAVMRDVEAMLATEAEQPKIDFAALEPWTDPKVWELIAHGHARAVHHIESPAMISLCKMCNVRDIDTLIAIVSVIRPGAANESKKMEFARRYQGLSTAHYAHSSLEPCLRSTFGLVVYEEHILQICESFADLPPGRADVLRRALGKDRADIISEIEAEFAACARRLGRKEPEITEVWDLVVGFKGYAFCKAHSTAYGVEAYQSAWLKLHYPAEFMAAVLTNGKGFYHPLVYVLECHRLGIPLLPPSVNQPGPQFTVTQKRIRVPVLNIKGLTHRTKEAILRERSHAEFLSLRDFVLRVKPPNEEMEALIQAGAFDLFGQRRTTQYWEYKALARSPAQPLSIHNDHGRSENHLDHPCAHGHSPHQLWLLPPEPLERLPSVPLDEPERLRCLRWEEDLLGYPVSGHPLELYPDIAWDSYCSIDQLGEHIGKQIVTCGLVIEQRLFHQATGEPMKFITIADWTGVVETELFARTYKSYGLTTVRYRVLEITATVEPFENGQGYTLRVLRAAKPRTRKLS